MAHFVLSSFADEVSPYFDEQLKALKEEGISLIELRGINGKSASEMTAREADEVKSKLDEAGIRLSSLGSPFGKAMLDVPFDNHLSSFLHGLEICKRLDFNRMRIFSFYPPKNDDPYSWRDEVYRRLSIILDEAEKVGVFLVHEKEKAIYGDITERCDNILKYFGTRMGFVFDPANFIQCGIKPLEAYDVLSPYITYMHIKDACAEDGSVVVSGHGDGDIGVILERINKDRMDEVILTIEPHLTIFDELNALQKEDLAFREIYPDRKTAFHAACAALKNIIKSL